jgi:uncharacterized protein (UPF0335 family)
MAAKQEKAGAVELECLEQIESNEADISKAKEVIKGIYASAAAKGIDPRALKQIIKDRKGDMEKTARLRAEVDKIIKALGDYENTELGEWAKATAGAQRSAKNSRPAKMKGDDGASQLN